MDLDELLIKRPSATYFVKVSGESVCNTGVSDGDLLVADRSPSTAYGDIVIAVIAGELTMKELRIRPLLQLVPHNHDYASISFHNAEELEVSGVVISSIKTHR